MSTARQVVDPYFLNSGTATANASRAAVSRPSLVPVTPAQFWFGDASSSLAQTPPRTDSSASSTTTSPTSASGGGGCCGG